MSVKLFYTSVSGSRQTKKNQDRIMNVLSSCNIDHVCVDIAQNSEDKDLMREMARNPTALPPQLCNGDVYCGDFTAFEEAIELGKLNEFLKI